MLETASEVQAKISLFKNENNAGILIQPIAFYRRLKIRYHVFFVSRNNAFGMDKSTLRCYDYMLNFFKLIISVHAISL